MLWQNHVGCCLASYKSSVSILNQAILCAAVRACQGGISCGRAVQEPFLASKEFCVVSDGETVGCSVICSVSFISAGDV